MNTNSIFVAIDDGCSCNVQKEANTSSTTTRNCFCVQRIVYISCLYHQQHHVTKLDPQFVSFLNGEFDLNVNYTIIALLNDFHHILSHHKSDLETIHSLLCTTCDVNTCFLLNSNSKHFGVADDNEYIAIFKILDNIHRHLYHTFDFGFDCTQKQRILIEKNMSKDKHEIEVDENIDSYLLNLKQSITSNKELDSLIRHKGAESLSRNKYTTIINENELCEHDGRIGVYLNETIPELMRSKSMKDYDENKIYSPKKRRQSSTSYNSQKYRTTDEKWKVYSFGKKWRYSDCYANDEKRKYSDLKTEILSNKLYSLSLCEWRHIICKANYLLQCDKAKSLAIGMNHIVAMCLYNDYMDLCLVFIATYRKLRSNESDSFYNLGRLLTESVDKYGFYLHKHKKNTIYHNISCKMVFKSTMINFLGPTSFSSSINVGLQYAIANKNGDGLMLKLCPFIDESLSISTKMIECDWMCNGFSSECEYFSIGNRLPVKTTSIILPQQCHNYEYYLAAIRVLNLFIHNKDCEIQMNAKIASAISNLITNQCLRYNINEETNYNQIQRNCLLVPKYIDKLFAFWIHSIRSSITINIEKLMYKAAFLPIQQLFISSNASNIDIDLILTLFRKVKRLKIWCKSKLILSHELIASFLNFLSFLDSKSGTKIKEIEIIKPSEKQCTMKEIVSKYNGKFNKLKWMLIENGTGVFPVLSIHKIRSETRAKSTIIKRHSKGKKNKCKNNKKPYEIEHNLRPSLSLRDRSQHRSNHRHTLYQL